MTLDQDDAEPIGKRTDCQAAGEQPRERFLLQGHGELGADELLATVLGTGTIGSSALQLARRVMCACGGLGALSRASPRDLMAVPGIGIARAVRIAGGFELARRAWSCGRDQNSAVLSSRDVYERLAPKLCHLAQEVFWVLAVDVRNCVMAEIEIARGSLTGVEVHPRDVFRPLIRMGAYGTIAVHNHPSGDATPSMEDIAITHRLREVGLLVGIPVIDHVIIGAGDFSSVNDWLVRTSE